MSSYESDRPRRKSAAIVILLILIVGGLAAGAWYLKPRFESDPPRIALRPHADAVGTGPIEISIADKGTGLKSFEVKLGEATIASEQFAQPTAETTARVVDSTGPGAHESSS